MTFKQAIEEFAEDYNIPHEDVEGFAWQIERIVREAFIKKIVRDDMFIDIGQKTANEMFDIKIN